MRLIKPIENKALTFRNKQKRIHSQNVLDYTTLKNTFRCVLAKRKEGITIFSCSRGTTLLDPKLITQCAAVKEAILSGVKCCCSIVPNEQLEY